MTRQCVDAAINCLGIFEIQVDETVADTSIGSPRPQQWRGHERPGQHRAPLLAVPRKFQDDVKRKYIRARSSGITPREYPQ